ncbi:MAG: RNA polymerase sigma factor RpoH [Burkholderiales bacterium]
MTTAMTIPMPATASSLESYVQAAYAIPVLTQEEEHDLAVRLKENGDVEAARRLVLSHLRVVVNIARGYLGYGLPQADLIQEGNIGLMKAVRRFDPGRGVRLVSFAVHWIRAEIHEYILKNWRLVKIATTKAQRKLFFNLRSMKHNTDTLSPQEVQDVAQRLDVREVDVVEMEMRFSGHEIALDGSNDDGESDYGPADYLADPSAEPLALLENHESESRHGSGMQKALSSLDERSRRIIEARWLDDDNATLHDLASEFGVSAERIRQIEQKAMQKMRGIISAEVEGSFN